MRQLFVPDRHAFCCIARLALATRQHDRHRFADEAHAPFGQHRARCPARGAAVAAALRHHDLDRTEGGGAQVGGGVNRQHTGRAEGLGGVDAQQACMHVGRAHKRGMHGPGQVEVIDVAPRAGEQRIVLQAAHWLADAQLPRGIQDGKADGAPSSQACPCM